MLNDGRGFNDAFEEQIGLQAESKEITMLCASFLTIMVYNFFLGNMWFFTTGDTRAKKTLCSRILKLSLSLSISISLKASFH